MDTNDTLKQLLDTLFRNKTLKSYTIHDGNNMTKCVLRFGDCDTNQDTAAERVTFKRKSKSQLQRDRLRHDRFNLPRTRSQVGRQSESEIENVRFDDDDDSDNLVGATGLRLSPEFVQRSDHSVNSPDPILCMNDSPNLRGRTVNAGSGGSPNANITMDSQCDMPSDADTEELSVTHDASVETMSVEPERDAEEHLLELCPGLRSDNSRKIDRELFINHYITRSPRIPWTDIKCGNITSRNRECPIAFDSPLIQRCPFRLRYCKSCLMYMCTYCSETTTHCLNCKKLLEFIT